MVKTSVIIPTYKSEKTISPCLKSIIKQSFKDFECLIVDYRENNKTYNIVKTYAKKYNFIKYIECPIKGAMAQREYGIKKASGQFICFVDSDDIIHQDYLAYLVKYSNISDFVVCEIKTVYNNDNLETIKYNNNNPKIVSFFNQNYKKRVKDIRNKLGYPHPVCLMAKKELFVKATKYYNSSIKIHAWEDALLFYFICTNAKSVVFIRNIPLYYYLKKEKNAANDANNYLNDTLIVSKTLIKIVKESLYKGLYKQTLIYATFGIISFLIFNYPFDKAFFKNTLNYCNCFVPIKKIRINEKEFSKAEKLLALSIKIKCFLIAKTTIALLNKRKTNTI